ncbi:MAG: alpha/beta hydrolase [Myxococcota bacterium]
MRYRLTAPAWLLCALLALSCAREQVRTGPAEPLTGADAGRAGADAEPGSRVTHLERAPRPEWESLPPPRRTLPPLAPSATRPVRDEAQAVSEPGPTPAEEAAQSEPEPPPAPVVTGVGEPREVRVWYATDRTRSKADERAGERRTHAVVHALAGLVLLLALLWWTRRRSRRARVLISAVVGALTVALVIADLLPSGEGPDDVYGAGRGDLEYGACEVTIPPIREPGEVERPSARRFGLVEDPSEHVALEEVVREDPAAFWSGAGEAMGAGREREALVFVHGGDTTFGEAARRAARLSWDLDLGGATILYSWPSGSGWSGRGGDEEAAAWTVPHLREVLDRVRREAGEGRVHLVAHGLGARILGEALQGMAPAPGEPGPARRFRGVVLLTPDIPAEVFRDEVVPAARTMAERVTVYASQNDAVLSLVRDAEGVRVAGEEVRALEGVDAVDASRVDTTLPDRRLRTGERPLVADMRRVLRAEAPEGAAAPRILTPAQ